MKRTTRFTLALIAGATIPMSLAPAALAFDEPATKAASDAKSMDKDAKKVWDRSVKASMGEAAEDRSSVKNIVSSGKMSMPGQGIEAPLTVTIVPGEGMRMAIEIPGMGAFDQGVYKGTAWSNNMMSGPTVLEGDEAEQLTRESDFFADMHWEKYYDSITYKGQETITLQDGTEITADVLELDPVDSDEVNTNYYNAETGLVVKSVSMVAIPGGGQIPSTTYMSDYRKLDNGMQFPHKTVIVMGPQQQILELSSVELNADLEDDALQPPADVLELMED